MTKADRSVLDDDVVTGPASVVDNRIAVFDGVTGKIIKDGGVIPGIIPQGRLSLVSGVPVPTNDVVGATTIYYVPTIGNQVPIYDGSRFVVRIISDQLVHPLFGHISSGWLLV